MNLPNIEHLLTMVSQMDALAEGEETKEYAAQTAKELSTLIKIVKARGTREGVAENYPLISQVMLVSAIRDARTDAKDLTDMQPSEHHSGMVAAYTKILRLLGAED